MGRIDTMTKEYLAHNDVFADAFNYLIYDGRQVIRPETLRELDTTEIVLPYGTDQATEAVQKFRDVLKELTVSLVGMEDEHAAYLIMGIESQTKVHYAMPVRNMLYDAMQYAGQVGKAKESYRKKGKDGEEKVKLTAEEFLSGFRKDDRLVPVITLVVYLGPDEWDAPVSLEEMFSIDNKELRPFIQNYKINLITPRQMEDQEFEKFHSGLGAVLLCAKHSKDRDLRVLEQPMYKQVDWKTARLIKEISAIDVDLDDYNKEGSVDMCEAYENTKRQMIEIGEQRGITIGEKRGIAIGEQKGIAIGEQRGIAIGEKSGIAQGEMKKAKEMAINLRSMGISIDMIAKAANVSDSLIKQWLEITTA